MRKSCEELVQSLCKTSGFMHKALNLKNWLSKKQAQTHTHSTSNSTSKHQLPTDSKSIFYTLSTMLTKETTLNKRIII